MTSSYLSTSPTLSSEAIISAVVDADRNGPVIDSDDAFAIKPSHTLDSDEDDFAVLVDTFLSDEGSRPEQDAKRAPIEEPTEIDYEALLANVNAQIEALQRSEPQSEHALGEGISAQTSAQQIENETYDRQLGGDRADGHARNE